MFGYVKPYIPELKVRQHELYKAVYCTLCSRQKKLTGFFTAFSLSYDFVFLALVRSEILREKFTLTDGRCDYNPLKKKKKIAPTRSIDYTAAVASVLTYYKIKDDINDTKGIGKLKYLPLLPIFSLARKRALKLGVPDKEVEVLLLKLSEIEKSKISSPDSASEIFGELLSLIAVYGVEDDLAVFALEGIFKNLGKWIYIMDAVDDLEKDLKKNRYNPFLADGKEDDVNFEAIKNTLQMLLSCIDTYVFKIKFSSDDISDIIKNIIFRGTAHIEEEVFARSLADNKTLN